MTARQIDGFARHRCDDEADAECALALDTCLLTRALDELADRARLTDADVDRFAAMEGCHV